MSLFINLLRGRAKRRALSDLMKLDDHLLSDIGVTRGDLLLMLHGNRRARPFGARLG